ncbi:MAG: HEAT repeat domain-containing protein [Tepidisphaeraceae bacterium]|jgi:HEAT repeat protein
MANDSPQRGRIVVIVMAVIMIAGSVLLTWALHVPTARHLRDLDSADPNVVSYSLVILKDRHDPAGIAKAEALLKSDDEQIRMNAARYLGAMGKPEAVPYLIQALSLADTDQALEMLDELTHLTGKPFGNDAKAWTDWWGESRASTRR